jgi:hypothetical protein
MLLERSRYCRESIVYMWKRKRQPLASVASLRGQSLIPSTAHGSRRFSLSALISSQASTWPARIPTTARSSQA